MNQPIAFLGCPTHDGRIDRECADILFSAASQQNVLIGVNQSSLLTQNCNHLYATALNYRKQYPSLKWFAMLHSDVCPEPFFLDKLIHLAEQENADMLSVIIPIKDQSGMTSTGIGRDSTLMMRLTQKQMQFMPPVFDLEKVKEVINTMCNEGAVDQGPWLYSLDKCNRLLANTGCMVVRLDQPWNEGISFSMVDYIIKDESGQWTAKCFPEDWFFSKSVADQGGKVMCTTAVKLKHAGVAKFSNQEAWGEMVDLHAKQI